MTIVYRDPFARLELHREIVRKPLTTCAWCGNTRKDGSLFKYHTETDSGRKSEHLGLFCSNTCHDMYHE